MYLKNMQGSALMLVHCLEQVKYYNRQVKNKEVYIHLWAPVAKGEHGHPTRTQTQVYRVPNMLSDRHTKEPGSMAWPPESIFIRSDDHIVTQRMWIIFVPKKLRWCNVHQDLLNVYASR